MNYGLIGEKLGHSFSAEIHRQLFDYHYELKEIPREELAAFIQSKSFSAINVTIPYKEMVIPYLDMVDETAQAIGAVNTIVNRNGKLYGYNTDFLGMKALIESANITLSGKKVLILGSGGTSKTALAVAESLHCSKAIRISRDGQNGCITYLQAKEQYSDADIIINTTPCGMYPNIGESAVDLSDYTQLQGVIDVVYNPLQTKLVCDAKQKGIPAVGGLYMLVAQAVFAAERFTDTKIPTKKIDEIYNRLWKSKQNIVLIGMPGCGKSTIGTLLAQDLGMDFVDTDAEIVRQEGSAIPEIFQNKGESYFRQLESSIIRKIATRQHTIISTGGGAVLNPENMAFLRENGKVYFLDRSLERLCATKDRPLSSDRDALEQRYRERYSIYCQECDVKIPGDGTIEMVATLIREDLEQ